MAIESQQTGQNFGVNLKSLGHNRCRVINTNSRQKAGDTMRMNRQSL
jgi:hypothetical protein